MDSTCGNKDLNSLICELSECGFSSGSAPTPPKTIQKYYETIEKNNKASVLHVEEEPEELTYCISGRGRGGKRTYMAPGGQISRTLYGKESLAFNNDINEELRQNIRATSGINYSNQYIQDFVRAKQAEYEARTRSKPGSPNVESTEISPENTPENIEIIESPPSPILIESKDDTEISISPEDTVELDENKNVDTSKGAIPKRPQPLSEMLKHSKPKHKKPDGIIEEPKSNLSPLASPFYPRNLASIDGSSSDSSSSSYEHLSWRRRVSPTQGYFDSWGRAGTKSIDIRSPTEFPVLK